MNSLFFSLILVLASAIVGCAFAVYVLWRLLKRLTSQFDRDERGMYELWALLHRHFTQMSGYDAIALTTPDGRLVVSLESVAWAIDARDLLSNEPVSVKPPSEPPPPDTERGGTYDGHA